MRLCPQCVRIGDYEFRLAAGTITVPVYACSEPVNKLRWEQHNALADRLLKEREPRG